MNYVPAMPRQYPGKAGVRGTAPEPVRGPRGEKRAMENVGSERNFGEQLATICRGFLFFSLRTHEEHFHSERRVSRTHREHFQFSVHERSLRVGQFSAANTRNSGTTSLWIRLILELGEFAPLCASLRAGTDVTERRANPSQPALGARMTFVARPHTPSNYYRATERPSDRATECLSDRATKRPSDRATERRTESDRPTDRATERPSDRATNRPRDRATERPSG